MCIWIWETILKLRGLWVVIKTDANNAKVKTYGKLTKSMNEWPMKVIQYQGAHVNM